MYCNKCLIVLLVHKLSGMRTIVEDSLRSNILVYYTCLCLTNKCLQSNLSRLSRILKHFSATYFSRPDFIELKWIGQSHIVQVTTCESWDAHSPNMWPCGSRLVGKGRVVHADSGLLIKVFLSLERGVSKWLCSVSSHATSHISLNIVE